MVERAGAGLAGLGLQSGQVVAVWSTNCVEYWVLCLAVWELGAVILPVNCLIQPHILASQVCNTARHPPPLTAARQQIRETGAALLVCDCYNVTEGVRLANELDCLQHVLLVGREDEKGAARNSNQRISVGYIGSFSGFTTDF